MTSIADLKLSPLTKSSGKDPVLVKREKMIERLSEQITLLNSLKTNHLSGQFRNLKRRNPETGIVELVQSDKKISPWWWNTRDGKYFLSVKYGTQTLELSKGKGAIIVDGLNGVESTLKILLDGTSKGELDEILNQAGSSLRKRFKN